MYGCTGLVSRGPKMLPTPALDYTIKCVKGQYSIVEPILKIDIGTLRGRVPIVQKGKTIKKEEPMCFFSEVSLDRRKLREAFQNTTNHKYYLILFTESINFASSYLSEEHSEKVSFLLDQ
uniref:Uncharacterized protein n=2 Tax=Cacopsylla melanoneura TaxID=428564 RepID=A0A8D9BD47_9HEMI